MSHPIAPKLILSFACLALFATPAAAVDIAVNTSPNDGAFNNYYFSPGQSFTVTGSGSYTNIRFNFYSGTAPIEPFAIGTGFLLSSAYTGAPGDLSSGTLGYLGHVDAAAGYYDFGSSVTLVAGVQYYLYSNSYGQMQGGVLRFNGDYAGGEMWMSFFDPPPNNNYSSLAAYSADALFRVTGDAVSAPVPDRGVPDSGTTVVLLAVSFLGLVALRRKLE